MIDPFSQMKREYNTILDDADSANRLITLSHLRALHDAFRETFLKVTNTDITKLQTTSSPPFFLGDSRASETRARVKIKSPHARKGDTPRLAFSRVG